MKTSNVVLLLVLCVICCCCAPRATTETYSEKEEKIADSSIKKLVPKLASRDIISRVAFTLGKTSKTKPDFMKKYWHGKSKAVILKAAPKYTLTNDTELVGPGWVSIKGHGKTRDAADRDAKAQARNVLTAIAERLGMRGLASSNIVVAY